MASIATPEKSERRLALAYRNKQIMPELTKKRRRRIVMMSLQFFHKYGAGFVDLIEHHEEENKEAWKVLREEIREIYEDLSKRGEQ